MPKHPPLKSPVPEQAAPSAASDKTPAAAIKQPKPAPAPSFSIDALPVLPPPSSAARSQPVQRVAVPNRTGLPDRLKSGIEALSGLAMDDVRVHRNSAEPAKLGALAYAKGSDIHLGAGQERHLPHEAWHVVQQKQGRVQATMQTKSIGINDSNALEAEADLMGLKAAAEGASSRGPRVPPASPVASRPVVQRTILDAEGGNSLDDEIHSGFHEEGTIAIRHAVDHLRRMPHPVRVASYADLRHGVITGRFSSHLSEPGLQPPIAQQPSEAIAESAPETVLPQHAPALEQGSGSGSGRSEAEPESKAREESPFGPHTSVWASSAHHDLKLIRSKASSAAQKPYGFSFVDKEVEKGDVRDINLFMGHVLKRDPPDRPADVQYGPASHAGAKPGMIQFHLNGRSYSTHAETGQLFPVSGAGIISGKGPHEMLAALPDNALDLGVYYALMHPTAPPWKSAGKALQKQVEAQFAEFKKARKKKQEQEEKENEKLNRKRSKGTSK